MQGERLEHHQRGRVRVAGDSLVEHGQGLLDPAEVAQGAAVLQQATAVQVTGVDGGLHVVPVPRGDDPVQLVVEVIRHGAILVVTARYPARMSCQSGSARSSPMTVARLCSTAVSSTGYHQPRWRRSWALLTVETLVRADRRGEPTAWTSPRNGAAPLTSSTTLGATRSDSRPGVARALLSRRGSGRCRPRRARRSRRRSGASCRRVDGELTQQRRRRSLAVPREGRHPPRDPGGAGALRRLRARSGARSRC